jgi:hypothetical protein
LILLIWRIGYFRVGESVEEVSRHGHELFNADGIQSVAIHVSAERYVIGAVIQRAPCNNLSAMDVAGVAHFRARLEAVLIGALRAT